MTQERVEKLEALGEWVWVARDRVDWNVRLDELRKYKEEHGDCLVPYRYPANSQLGGWVRTQREQYKLLREGKTSHMTQDRIEALEELGFVWSLHEIWAQQDQNLEKAIQAAAKKKRENDVAASAMIRTAAAAIAATNPDVSVSVAATSAAVAAAGAAAAANPEESGQAIADAVAEATKKETETEDESADIKPLEEEDQGYVDAVNDAELLDDVAFV